MSELTSSVFIPSYGRLKQLTKCLLSLKRQLIRPSEVIVVYQADDLATRDLCGVVKDKLPFSLRAIYSPVRGIVSAENRALEHSKSDIILLIDDDAVAPRDWLRKHLALYENPRVGAAGGPVRSYAHDRTPFPELANERIGALSWFGRISGNMHDQPREWRKRSPVYVTHLMGCNMSLRREAFDKFEESLKPYWQYFELDACLQVKSGGYEIIFDFSNIVKHYPCLRRSQLERAVDCDIRIYNAAYNNAFIMSRRSKPLLFPCRFLYSILVGYRWMPGPLLWPFSSVKYGAPLQELGITGKVFLSRMAGWFDGVRVRLQSHRKVAGDH